MKKTRRKTTHRKGTQPKSTHPQRTRSPTQTKEPGSWGGWRPGAGRKPKGERAGVSHLPRQAVAAGGPVLVTLRLRAGLPALRRDDAHAVVRDALRAASGGVFRVVEYALRIDHVLLIVEPGDGRGLARGMTGLGVRVSRGLNRLWRREGRVFADRYDARVLATPESVRAALVRVLQGARGQGTWRRRSPDAYSSGPEFDGWKGRKAAARAARFLPPARTRLLARAWRRLGLLDPRELPPSETHTADAPTSGSARSRASARAGRPRPRARP